MVKYNYEGKSNLQGTYLFFFSFKKEEEVDILLGRYLGEGLEALHAVGDSCHSFHRQPGQVLDILSIAKSCKFEFC